LFKFTVELASKDSNIQKHKQVKMTRQLPILGGGGGIFVPLAGF